MFVCNKKYPTVRFLFWKLLAQKKKLLISPSSGLLTIGWEWPIRFVDLKGEFSHEIMFFFPSKLLVWLLLHTPLSRWLIVSDDRIILEISVAASAPFLQGGIQFRLIHVTVLLLQVRLLYKYASGPVQKFVLMKSDILLAFRCVGYILANSVLKGCH